MLLTFEGQFAAGRESFDGAASSMLPCGWCHCPFKMLTIIGGRSQNPGRHGGRTRGLRLVFWRCGLWPISDFDVGGELLILRQFHGFQQSIQFGGLCQKIKFGAVDWKEEFVEPEERIWHYIYVGSRSSTISYVAPSPPPLADLEWSSLMVWYGTVT